MTILVTDQLEWWQDKVLSLFGTDYTVEQKDLSSGNQIAFKDCKGVKFLTLSF